MPELVGLSPQAKEIQKPERLPDEELGDLLAALGNHEAKAITLGLMKPGIIYTNLDLYHAIIEAQGQNPGWIINRMGPFAYCHNSLAPIGLVAQEVTMAGGLERIGYMKTEKGGG